MSSVAVPRCALSRVEVTSWFWLFASADASVSNEEARLTIYARNQASVASGTFVPSCGSNRSWKMRIADGFF